MERKWLQECSVSSPLVCMSKWLLLSEATGLNTRPLVSPPSPSLFSLSGLGWPGPAWGSSPQRCLLSFFKISLSLDFKWQCLNCGLWRWWVSGSRCGMFSVKYEITVPTCWQEDDLFLSSFPLNLCIHSLPHSLCDPSLLSMFSFILALFFHPSLFFLSLHLVCIDCAYFFFSFLSSSFPLPLMNDMYLRDTTGEGTSSHVEVTAI